MVLLSDSVGDVSGDGAEFFGPLNVKHLVVKVDVRFYLLQQGPFWGSGQEESLVHLQAPTAKGLQHSGPRAGGAAGRDQEGSYGAIQTLVFGVEFSLELP